MLLRRSGLKRQRLCRWPRLAPRLDPRLPARMTAWGGLLFDELSPGMAGSSAEQDARAEQWRNNKQPSFSPLLFIISAFGGNDEQCSEAEKIAGSDFSRAKRARRARIRDDTRKSS